MLPNVMEFVTDLVSLLIEQQQKPNPFKIPGFT
ncbi:hypothetical protein DSTSK_16790 [Desulforhabdus sp. TSK]|nr:hypothetical protein DSTSK_16790 [Desulforhabdus sp. TSK]